MIKLEGARVYDPANEIDGKIMDLISRDELEGYNRHALLRHDCKTS